MDFLGGIMKIKPFYFYLALAVIVIVILLISSQQSPTAEKFNDLSETQITENDIHKDLNNPMSQTPGSANVTSETMRRMEELKKAYNEDPGDTVKIIQYADFLQMAHRPEEAIPLYEKILEIDSGRIDVLFALTFIYYNKADLVKAEELTKIILVRDPDNIMALYNYGAIEATRGNKAEARALWTRIVKEFPQSETTELAKTSLSRLGE